MPDGRQGWRAPDGQLYYVEAQTQPAIVAPVYGQHYMQVGPDGRPVGLVQMVQTQQVPPPRTKSSVGRMAESNLLLTVYALHLVTVGLLGAAIGCDWTTNNSGGVMSYMSLWGLRTCYNNVCTPSLSWSEVSSQSTPAGIYTLAGTTTYISSRNFEYTGTFALVFLFIAMVFNLLALLFMLACQSGGPGHRRRIFGSTAGLITTVCAWAVYLGRRWAMTLGNEGAFPLDAGFGLAVASTGVVLVNAVLSCYLRCK